METLEDIRKIGVKLKIAYYKCYQRALELSCSIFYLEYINDLNYYNLMIEPGNKLENILRSHST